MEPLLPGFRTLLRMTRCAVPALAMLAAALPAPGFADSSSPLLAAYYDRQMAVRNGVAYAWRGNGKPEPVAKDVKQVGVGRSRYYVLTRAGQLLQYRDGFREPKRLMNQIATFAAGRTGVLAVRTDDTLWWIEKSAKKPEEIASQVMSAAVGDSANYYVTKAGALFVKGKAHRGQYGDGRLAPTKTFVQTASEVAKITAHTGHAILLKTNGDVMGTGGNIYGPVGKHGLGDKAVKWSKIFAGAKAIATGSSHTLAIREDGTLFVWGREYGPEPAAIMADVTAVAAGSSTSLALTQDGTLWQWDRGGKPQALSLD